MDRRNTEVRHTASTCGRVRFPIGRYDEPQPITQRRGDGFQVNAPDRRLGAFVNTDRVLKMRTKKVKGPKLTLDEIGKKLVEGDIYFWMGGYSVAQVRDHCFKGFDVSPVDIRTAAETYCKYWLRLKKRNPTKATGLTVRGWSSLKKAIRDKKGALHGLTLLQTVEVINATTEVKCNKDLLLALPIEYRTWMELS